ncbi:DNA primase [mine drainage metagenome]|uniref:DNA primase n=1 Tax=mine drainage metagenome TaxID=410659 RepID=A0A1J5RQY1_9ZZZZ
MIPDSFIQELLSRVDIVDVVERRVPLKKAGANYSACCPFHSEKTPSFTVSPAKQFYHCFGCGVHGSAIGFVMQYSGIGFIEAVEELAGGVGLQVPQQIETRRQEAAKKAPLTEFMARAAKFYREQLKVSPGAIDYLKGRGLSGEIAARFGLGYAPEGWQNLEQVFPDYPARELAECGLVIDNEQGRRYDRFRHRIMFPILDQRGNVIGFGGRVLDQGEPKYLNSPETPLFEKGRELYGLPQARQAIRDSDTVIVVEGYMDVVALAQHGIANAVATLGTATTPNHVHKLLRQAERVVFCFDGDSAGRKAAWRALEASLEQIADNKSAGFLFLPPEHDPDSFVREQGAAAFQQMAAQPTTLTEFLLRELRSRVDLASAEGRSRLVHEAKPYLVKIAAPLLRLQLTKQIAAASGFTQAEVEAQCGLKTLLPAGRQAPPRSAHRPQARSIEHRLLENVLRRPERAARLPLDLLAGDQPEGAALRAIADVIDHGALPAGGVGQLLEHFRGSEHETTLALFAGLLAAEEFDEAALEEEFSDCLERLRHTSLTRSIGELSHKERAGGLTAEERQQLAALLAQKTAAAAGRREK